MASPHNFLSKPFLLKFLVLTSALLVATTPTNAASLLDDVCSHTKDKALCLRELKKDPNTGLANLPKLIELTIDALEYNAGQTKIKIHSFLLSAKTPQLKQIYIQCENLYDDALRLILATYVDLKAHLYSGIVQKGQRARNAPTKCEALSGNKSPFTVENHLVETLIDALVAEACKSAGVQCVRLDDLL